ncbi:IclR family transcriptional regulator [Limosilactobacillus sp.]|uniref:IclR family transcriptional regulator n=1 Tax=Limosilactobacillus sp. TaxID=2773925 RepID=UPI003F0FA04B
MREGLTSTLVKATRIREYVARHPGCALKDIVAGLGLNKTTAYRLLMTLVQLKWLTKQGNCYYLQTQQQDHRFQPVGWLASQAVQPLVDARRLTAFLGMQYDGALVISQVFACADRLSDFTLLGERQALNASALGKCLLAFMDEPTRTAILQTTKWRAATKHSLTDQHDLLYSLAAIRDQGYALDDEEVQLNMRCLAVPVYSRTGQLVATLGVSGSDASLQRRQIKSLAHELDGVSHQLTNLIF